MNVIDEFWSRFVNTNPQYKDKKYIEAFYFSLSEKSANHLLKLVLDGKKTATCSSLLGYQIENEKIPMPKDLSIVTDFKGVPFCVIETKVITILPFNQMTFDICRREGEDECLETWVENHEHFFTEESKMVGYKFTNNMLVVFEDFEVIYKEN